MSGCSMEVGTTRTSTFQIKLALRVNIETPFPILAVREELAGDCWMGIRTIVSVSTVGPKPTSLSNTGMSILLLLFVAFN